MKTKLKFTFGCFLGLLASALCPSAFSQGTAFTYQGRLMDNGTPYTGSAELQPTLWDAASGGTALATNAPASVVVGVTNGLFVLPLDFSANFPGANRWLQLEVRTTIGAFTVLSPRQPLTATPYAITASNLTGPLPAAQLSGAVPSANLEGTYSSALTLNNAANSFTGTGAGLTALNASQLTSGTVSDARIPAAITRDAEVMPLVLANDGAGSGLDADLLDGLDSTAFVRTNGPVSIGGSSASAPILTVTQASSHDGLLATTASTASGRAGVTGRAGGAAPTISGVSGVLGSSFNGRGVIGSSSTNDGVFGFSSSGRGVHAQSSSGTGAEGRSFANSGAVYGVRGVGQSSGGAGVRGDSTSGNGVEGYATATSGARYGVHGVSSSTNNGAGVRGNSPYVGVWGAATSTSGANWGVYGTTASTSGYGGYFLAPSGGTAARFIGNVSITGSLSKGSGSFKIDHPLDPANKYLYHSFVESPDMMNIYNGNIILDETGSARVTLPPYFAALNRDFRYQLTAVGGPGPNLHIAEPVHNKTFRIAGGAPGLQVSWQVTGIRQDAFANANRIQVEVDKPDEERGTYLHAEALGHPSDKGLHRVHQPEFTGRGNPKP